MNILVRFREIMASNIHAMLDKAEDPEKMIDQYLRNLNNDLGKVKSETATIMAEEQRVQRDLDECVAEMDKMQSYAVKALEAGNEDDARKFLARKSSMSVRETELRNAHAAAASNVVKMREMHDKLIADVKELEERKTLIKGKLAVAKAQERINNIHSSAGSANRSISAFERMEQKANAAYDKANAMAELNVQPKDDIDDLMAKYSTGSTGSGSGVDDELEALKRSLDDK
ncbi:PspA/IM30 family protein [Halalkalibacter sp. AB-rgal2]|uniref:PspA/IM30 family protein n=1 Tax=Halalkalibacter sp. AB-rgal2 TaxID=3242695 RepID=UPI00359DC6C1